MSIHLDEVRHVARLARLSLEEPELELYLERLNKMLEHFEDIAQLDVEGRPAKPHAVALQNVWAEDVPHEPLSREEALRNAATSKAGLFIVPTILEE